jgi:hypothetical protein
MASETTEVDVNRISLEKLSPTVRAALLSALLTLLATFLVSTTGAEAANKASAFGKGGVFYACYKVKGKNRGAVRLVNRPRRCKKLRGWRRMSWSANGATGVRGSTGSPGDQGSPGAAGGVDQSLLETIQTQSSQIDTLTKQVTTLSQQVTGLEGTVASACSQLTALTTQADDLGTAVAGISLNGVLTGLGGALQIPSLPAALGSFACA